MSDASIIRTILARECDTVNEYEQLAARAESPRIRSLVLHFAQEEKEHIAECALVLARIDADYARFMDKSLTHIDAAWADDAAADDAAAEPPSDTARAAQSGAAARSGAATIKLPSGAQITNDPYARTIGSLFRTEQKS